MPATNGEAEQGASTAEDLGSAPTLVADPGSGSSSQPQGDDVVDSTGRSRARESPFDVPAEHHKLGRYLVLGKLGSGGMGTVLEAFDRTLDRRVALKVLHGNLEEVHAVRLLREAQALAKLSHPNVVQVYEVGQAKGDRAFIAMELVQGRSLKEWLARDPRPSWRDCVQVYLQAGEGLAAAHARGLVHRDFKPGNAVIDDDGRVRVLDFGLARRAEDVATTRTSVEPAIDDSALDQPLTRTGTVLGTPAYMAPEQLQGLEADARSDQFGYCVALHEALYGERPFDGSSIAALMVSMISGGVRPAPAGTDVPAALRALVLRGLAIDPAERWPSIDVLLVELRRLVSPPRRGWLALGVAAGLTAIGLGIAQYAAVGFRCDGAQAQLEGIWDDERRTAVGEAILGTELSYAADTWARVERGLDEYASAWAEKHTEVCEATSVRREQSAELMDLRMECLGERRVALREAVGVLAGADATRVEKAVQLVSGLPRLKRCDDVDALRAELPSPEDPEVAAEVGVVRERLAQVRALELAGAYDEALAQVEPAVEQAQRLSHAPLLAEALLARGLVRDDLAHYAEAEQDAEQAYVLAAEHGHAGVEVRAVTLLVWVVGHRRARHEHGRLWGTTALALAKGARIEREVEASAFMTVGTVLAGQDRLDEALTHLQRALAIAESVWGPHHSQVATMLNGVANVLSNQGELDEALRYHERALAIREQTLGPRHPDVAASLNNVGIALARRGRHEEALAHMQRSLAIAEDVLGARHPSVAAKLVNIGTMLRMQGKYEEAQAHHQRALAIEQEVLGLDHPDVAFSLDAIGMLLAVQGQPDEASDYIRRALAVRERVLGPDHSDVARSLTALAEIELNNQDPRAAREHAERAISILEAHGTSPDFLAATRFILARALGSEPSQRSRARALAERAREGYVALGQEQPLAGIDAWLAEHPVP